MITLAIAVFALVLYFILACVLLRLTSQKYALTVLAVAAASTFIGIVVGFRNVLSVWHFASYYSLVVIGVVFVYGLALKSLSLRMLTTLAETDAPVLSRQEMADCVVRPAFRERIDVLVARQMVAGAPGRFVPTAGGVTSAQRVLGLRRALKLSSSGLYGA